MFIFLDNHQGSISHEILPPEMEIQCDKVDFRWKWKTKKKDIS